MSLELAIFWGFVSGLPLVVGAVVTRFFTFNQKTIGIIMAFGSGVMTVISFSLMKEAYELGGFHISLATAAGFLVAFVIGLQSVT
ncbi:MAG: ZIP family zinc transporter [Candidatus Nitrosomirales archaeon]|jgi:ZIP family zinc transporter